MNRSIFIIIAYFATASLWAQGTATVFGKVTDASTGAPLELVTVYLDEIKTVVETKRDGSYEILVPADERFTLVFSRVAYQEARTDLAPTPEGRRRKIDVALVPIDVGVEVIVRESRVEDAGMVREDIEDLRLLPTTTGNLESVLPAIALGVSSGTGGELSSQYNVRGGNYDENLVYVNDFEIYRPQLIRAGQQEGLTFANMDLVRDLYFSSGGFQAKYGDKQSSVLDIRYKRPEQFKSSFSASFLGGAAHIEGSVPIGTSSYKKFRYLVGARYKTTRYLLGSLQVEGEYVPNFTDVQGYFTYELSRDWQIGLLANYNRSVYNFTPQSRSTAFGLINFALELFTVFDGQETDDFTTGFGGLSLTYLPERDRNPLYLKFLASTYQSNENERFDIIGDYSLRQIESNFGSDNFGEVLAELGTGTQQQYVRNFLTANVTNFQHKGGIEFQLDPEDLDVTSSHFLQWGARFQTEMIQDQLNEWERLDSAGYSLPYDPGSVQLFSVLKTENQLFSSRMTGFVQNTFTWIKDSVSDLRLTVGVRGGYWSLNKELFVTPRVQLLYKPMKGKDVSFRLAGGLYYQPPFYRELRSLQGTIDSTLLAQKSAHFVAGMTRDFYWEKLSRKPFRFIMEVYYKRLWDLVSYDIENVRIRYSGANDATGYVTGLDLRLNGEFVPGAESWFNISFLRAREALDGVQHLRREIGLPEAEEVKDVPRPTDQFMTLSVFFQDYLPKNENFKMHLNFTVGTGLPYGLLGNNEVYRNTYRFSPYHRVDIGFAIQLWEAIRRAEKPNHPLRFTKSTWISLEVFNLMAVQNVASNTWIKTIFDQQYAIPNYLTSRRINLRLRMEF